MAALTGTVAHITPLAAKRILILTTTAPTSASDAVTLTLATHGVRTIYAVIPIIQAGLSADFATISVSFSGLVITLVSKNAAGAAATAWTDVTLRLVCIVD